MVTNHCLIGAITVGIVIYCCVVLCGRKMHKYSVVEFSAEGSVDVVVASWVFVDDNRTLSYWRPATQLSHALRKCEPTGSSWTYYECRQCIQCDVNSCGHKYM